MTMRRNLISESLNSNERGLFDPTEIGAFERLHTREVLQGEGALMLGNSGKRGGNLPEVFFAQNDIGRKLFQEAEEWFLQKNADLFFSFESICETFRATPGLHT